MRQPDPTPSNPFDVARERWIAWRYLAVTCGLVACVYMMTKCSEKWMDKEAQSTEAQG